MGHELTLGYPAREDLPDAQSSIKLGFSDLMFRTYPKPRFIDTPLFGREFLPPVLQNGEKTALVVAEATNDMCPVICDSHCS